ncbi:MAG: hypothetical protein LH613_19070 [Chamaesiphon sp.]|nr:hypothetical protein [Chamaesiphon sp.]
MLERLPINLDLVGDLGCMRRLHQQAIETLAIDLESRSIASHVTKIPNVAKFLIL